MNLFDREYVVTLLACKATSPPFYVGEGREAFGRFADTLQQRAGTDGAVTVDLTANGRAPKRVSGLKLRQGVSFWEGLPVKAAGDTRLESLLVTVPSYRRMAEEEVPVKYLIRVLFHHENPSPTADFLVMWAVSAEFASELGESYDQLFDALVALFSPVAVLRKRRPFALSRGSSYLDALIDFTTSKILDDVGVVRTRFSDWDRIR